MLLQLLLILPFSASQGRYTSSTVSHLPALLMFSSPTSPYGLLSPAFFSLTPTGHHIAPPHLAPFLHTISQLLTSSAAHSHQSPINHFWGPVNTPGNREEGVQCGSPSISPEQPLLWFLSASLGITVFLMGLLTAASKRSGSQLSSS